MSSVLNSFFGSKTRDNRMLHNTSIVSWIAIAFVGLLELSEFASRAKGTDRAETCEVLKDRLHQVETESKELRGQSCWIFQFQCSWTCSLLQLALLSVAMLTLSWLCDRSCTRRVNVVVDSDGSQKRGITPAYRCGVVSAAQGNDRLLCLVMSRKLCLQENRRGCAIAQADSIWWRNMGE